MLRIEQTFIFPKVLVKIPNIRGLSKIHQSWMCLFDNSFFKNLKWRALYLSCVCKVVCTQCVVTKKLAMKTMSNMVKWINRQSFKVTCISNMWTKLREKNKSKPMVLVNNPKQFDHKIEIIQNFKMCPSQWVASVMFITIIVWIIPCSGCFPFWCLSFHTIVETVLHLFHRKNQWSLWRELSTQII